MFDDARIEPDLAEVNLEHRLCCNEHFEESACLWIVVVCNDEIVVLVEPKDRCVRIKLDERLLAAGSSVLIRVTSSRLFVDVETLNQSLKRFVVTLRFDELPVGCVLVASLMQERISDRSLDKSGIDVAPFFFL